MIHPEPMRWSDVLEWCAEAFGATRRSRWLPFLALTYGSIVVSIVFGARWGFFEALAPAAIVLIIGPYVAHKVVRARDELWRAACLDLEDPRQMPRPMRCFRPFLAPTAIAVARLAVAVDQARRGSLKRANEVVSEVERRLLRDDEVRLLEAIRALSTLASGDKRRAAQQAVLALPSGSEAIDADLGRVVVEDAWREPARLAAIDAAWDKEGIGVDHDGALARLRVLVRMRAFGGDVASLGHAEARALVDDARAIGDEDLATELESHARSGTYR